MTAISKGVVTNFRNFIKAGDYPFAIAVKDGVDPIEGYACRITYDLDGVEKSQLVIGNHEEEFVKKIVIGLEADIASRDVA